MTTITNAGVKLREGNTAHYTIQGKAPGRPATLKGVFFGPPKTGKTTLACSGRGGTLLMSFDPEGDATETLEGRDDIVVVQPRTVEEINKIIQALASTDKGRFRWVVVDSLSFLYLMIGGKAITTAWAANKDPRRAYGQTGAIVQQIVHDLMLLDQNVILTAHLERVKQEDDGVVSVETKLGEAEIKLAITPMVWSLIGPAVSFIGRTYKETVWEKTEKGRNKKTRFAVSFNDGDRSPAGSRLRMEGEYEITGSTLEELATSLGI